MAFFNKQSASNGAGVLSLRVGKPFTLDSTKPPQDSISAHIIDTLGLAIIIKYAAPYQDEKKALSSNCQVLSIYPDPLGKGQVVAFGFEDNIVFKTPIMSADRGESGLAPDWLTNRENNGVHFFLVDRKTNILKHNRNIGCPPDFKERLAAGDNGQSEPIEIEDAQRLANLSTAQIMFGGSTWFYETDTELFEEIPDEMRLKYLKMNGG